MNKALEEVHFFVYGTLKRGECREICWPCKPTTVEQAWVYGELYDAGSYPALVSGHDRVLGELWTFPESRFREIVRVLDEVEEYHPESAHNLYNRERIDCETLSGRRELAYTYLYARLHDLPRFPRLARDTEGSEFVQWRSR